MFNLRGSLLAASAVLFFAGAAFSADNVLLALNTPAKPDIAAKVQAVQPKAQAAAQVKADYTDFDAVSVNDPLYREGSREMLKQVIKDEESVKDAAKPVLRDAPISKPAAPAAKPVKKLRVKKPVRTDPVKAKSTL